MIVTSSGVIIAGSRILINDIVNEFLGTVNNLWNNASNWSLGVVPTSSQVAVISSDCSLNVNTTVKDLVIRSGINFYGNGMLTVNRIFTNNGIYYNTTLTGGSYETTIRLYNETVIGDFNNRLSRFFSYTLDYIPVELLNKGLTPTINYSSIFSTSGLTNVYLKQNDLNNTFGNSIKLELATSGCNFRALTGNLNILFDNPTFLDITGARIDFRDNNPIINFKNVTVSIDSGNYQKYFGTGMTYFEGSNSILAWASNNSSLGLNNITIKSGSTLTFTNINPSPSSYGLYLNGVVNGENSTSVLKNNIDEGKSYLYLNNYFPPMYTTGIFDCTTTNSRVMYTLGGNQLIGTPKDNTYKYLELSGSGIKYLTGNISCDHLSYSGSATLNTTGYTLSGYTKYTDNGTVNRSVPSGTFDTITIGTASQGMKTLSGNIICNLFDFYTSTNSYINYNGFSISATTFNDTFNVNNLASHIGGTRNNVRWSSDGTVNLTTPMVITNTLEIPATTTGVNTSGSTLTMVSGSTVLFNRQSNQNLTLGIGSYPNLNLTPLGGTAVVTRTLVQNIVVTGTFTLGGTVTLIKNGFTIVDGSGNPLA